MPITPEDRARQAVRRDDILFSNVRTYLRKIARIEQEYPNPIASTGFTVIRPAEGVSSKFLLFQILSDDFLQPLNALQTGSSYPAVRTRDVFAQPILLPPTNEQEAIAAKLSAVFLAVERAETASKRAKERLKRYRVAVLDAAVTGKLTHGWRAAHVRSAKDNSQGGEALLDHILKTRREEWKGKGKYQEPALPATGFLPKPTEGWTIASLEQLTSANRVICYGILMPKENIPNGVPYVKVRDIIDDKINLGSLSRTSPQIAAKYARSSLKAGDILLAIRGTYGRVAEVPPELEGGNITQDTARLAFTHLVESRYIAWFLRSDLAQAYFHRVARGIAVRGVNIADVRLCPTLLPPISEQEQIVHEVERRVSAAKQLATTLNQHRDQSLTMRQSVLRQAFAGDLVSQNTNDEPVSVLLDHIRAAQKIRAQKPKGKTMARVQTKLKRRPLIEVLREHNKAMTPELLFERSGYQQEFKDNECRQEIVDAFYEELRRLISQKGPVIEKRPRGNTVLLGVKS